MTSGGSPHARFQRALATGNLSIVRAAAAELPHVGLADAAEICRLIAGREPAAFERAALRWMARYCAERPASLTAVAEAADALELMRTEPDAGAVELRGILGSR